MNAKGEKTRTWAPLVGAGILVLGLVVSWSVVGGGVDFPVLYVMGRGLIAGTNVYLPSQTSSFPAEFGVSQIGMFYPPATGFAMVPLALFPYRAAKLLWFLLIDASLVFGIRALVQQAAPRARAEVWMISAGVVLLSAALRWGLMLLQAAPLVLGLLCLFVVALHTNRPRTALALAVFVNAMKMTLAFPFLGLLALHRRPWAIAASVGTWAGLNTIGFLRMGSGSLADYRWNMARLEAIDNISSPDPWKAVALPRLDWSYLFYGLSNNLPASRLVSLVLSAGVLIWLIREGLRASSRPDLRATALFLAPLVCLGSLCVYHHQYDACLFFAPALLGCLLFGYPHKFVWPYLPVMPLVLMILVLPIGKMQSLLQDLFGLFGVGVLKLMFPVVFTLALVGSLILLRSQLKEIGGVEERGG